MDIRDVGQQQHVGPNKNQESIFFNLASSKNY